MSTRAVVPIYQVNVALVTPTISLALNITPTPLSVAVTLVVSMVPIANPSPLAVAVTLKTPTVVLV